MGCFSFRRFHKDLGLFSCTFLPSFPIHAWAIARGSRTRRYDMAVAPSSGSPMTKGRSSGNWGKLCVDIVNLKGEEQDPAVEAHKGDLISHTHTHTYPLWGGE